MQPSPATPARPHRAAAPAKLTVPAGVAGAMATSQQPERAVSLQEVGARLGPTPVLRGVCLEVAAGEVVGLAGANGSGKTTLLRVLATLLAPTSGTGTVLGAPLGSRERFRVRPAIALVGHTPALYPQLSLEENLALVARLGGLSTDRVGEALAAVGLAGAARRRALACSQGMLRRAELARVLLTRPRLLLLDAAHAGLDTAATGLVAALLDAVRARGGAAVVVSHTPSLLRAVADRTVEVAAGRLVEPQEPRR